MSNVLLQNDGIDWIIDKLTMFRVFDTDDDSMPFGEYDQENRLLYISESNGQFPVSDVEKLIEDLEHSSSPISVLSVNDPERITPITEYFHKAPILVIQFKREEESVNLNDGVVSITIDQTTGRYLTNHVIN